MGKKKIKAIKTKKEPKQPDIVKPIELSMADKFYIEQHIKSQNIVVLSKMINKPVELVQQHLETIKTQKQGERYMEILASDEKAKGYIRTDKGATIMTETASEIADANRGIKRGKSMSDRIHRMK